MDRTIKLNRHKWDQLRHRIEQDYGKSTATISFVTRRDLGFTPRRYEYYDKNQHQLKLEIHLDFFDAELETLFRLKYFDIISD
jgi:hypothetical protein